MDNKSPAYQWYPKDILASARVQMMSLAEEGAYRRLLDYCWINGSVPNDSAKAARLIGKGCTAEIAKVALEMFIPHPTDSDKLLHERIEAEREKQKSNSNARRKASAARWNKQGKSADGRGSDVKSKSDANAMQMDMQNDALHISSSSSEKSNDFSHAVNPKADQELIRWMDGVAESMGLTRFTLADSQKWEAVCIKAIESGCTLESLVKATQSELARLSDAPQYFSPNSVLRQIQITGIKTPFRNEFTGRGLK